MSGELVPYDGIVGQVANVIPEDMQGSAFITSYDVVVLDGKYILAYTLDTDGNLSTSSDREIYAVDYTVTGTEIIESEPRRLTASGEEADAPQFVRRFEDPAGSMERVYGTHLIYQSGGTIKLLDMDSETPAEPVTLVDGGVEDFIARDYLGECYVLFHAGGQTYVIPDPTYTPTVNVPDGYQVTTDPARPEAGDEVTITVEPEGYVGVTDADGNEVEVVRNPDGSWSYIQPDGAVTITVMPAFDDVSDSEWYFDSVLYTYAHGLMTGVSATRFEPNSTLTRAIAVTILWRMEGRPAVSYDMPFTDVESDAWYTEAVRWTASEGVVKGMNDTTFAPGDEITREQLATILWRYAGKPTSDAVFSDYIDSDRVSAWAVDALSWCVDNKVIFGTSPTTLAPQETATRAQAAAILMRYTKL